MSGIDIFAWFVLITIIICVVWLAVYLAALPGKIAKKRGHPQADAINALGWLGLLFFGVIWVLALGWALMTPVAANDEELEQLKLQVANLQADYTELKTHLAQKGAQS